MESEVESKGGENVITKYDIVDLTSCLRRCIHVRLSAACVWWRLKHNLYVEINIFQVLRRDVIDEALLSIQWSDEDTEAVPTITKPSISEF